MQFNRQPHCRARDGSPNQSLSIAFSLTVLWSVIIVALPVAVQAADAWFGLDMPEARERRSDNHRAVYLAPDFAPLSLRLAAVDEPYTDIQGEAIYQYLTDIVDITVENRPPEERYWGRIAGSKAELAAADYMARQFTEFGLENVRAEPVAGQAQWWPLDWDVTVIGDPEYGAGTDDYTFTSSFPAVQLGTGALNVPALEAELVYVGLGRPVDLLNRDLAGKIAVVRSELQPDPFFQTARGYIEEIIHAGAVGVVTILDAPGNHQYALERMGPPDVPCFVLGGDDGRFLEEAIVEAAKASRPLKMRLGINSEVRDSWQGNNVLGLVPGSSDEYVIILAHLDGYFESANDNAGGLASMLALARHYSRPDAQQPKRNLLFVGTSAHHEFSDGARAFIADHPDILEKTVLVFNVEHPSSIKSYYRGPLKLERVTVPAQLTVTTAQSKRSLTISNKNPLLVSFYKEAIDRYGMTVDARFGRRPTGDAYDFFLAGHTVVQILDANLWFHSSGDRLDTIHPNGLARATRLYAFVLDRIDQTNTEALGR